MLVQNFSVFERHQTNVDFTFENILQTVCVVELECELFSEICLFESLLDQFCGMFTRRLLKHFFIFSKADDRCWYLEVESP